MIQRGEQGFTLIETVVGLTIMVVLITAISQLFVDNLRVVELGKARAIGLALASEQIEYLRDLPYDTVRTQNGTIYPPGNLPDNQTLVRGGYTFNVVTEINYVDDPFDGNAAGTIVGKPQDLNPADYKKAQITVYLKSSGQMVAKLTTDIAGKAAETASNTGVLSVRVLDATGQPVANATVTIVNTTPTPNVNITTTTDNQGYVVVPNLPPDSNNEYKVTASLAGYSTDQTIPDPVGAPTAVELNPNILVQQVTSLSLAIDRVSSLNIHVTDTTGAAIPNLSVTTTGAKKTQNNPTIYKTSLARTTDASGNIALTSLEWDSYSFTLPSSYYLVTSQPYSPLALAPNTSQTVNLVVSTSSTFPTIQASSPLNSQTGTSNQSINLTGTNLTSGSSVRLKQTGQSDIVASSITSSNGNKTLTFSVNLNGAATGAWDIVVTTSSGTVTQSGGLNVTP